MCCDCGGGHNVPNSLKKYGGIKFKIINNSNNTYLYENDKYSNIYVVKGGTNNGKIYYYMFLYIIMILL